MIDTESNSRPYKDKTYIEKSERYCAAVDNNVMFNIIYDDSLTERRECLNYQSCENKSECDIIIKN